MLSDMIDKDLNVHQALQHTQNDIRMSLNLANSMDHSCPITASVNEVFKRAIQGGYGQNDSSAVVMDYINIYKYYNK